MLNHQVAIKSNNEVYNMKALKGIWTYLKDWKNLLAHALIGVGILLVALLIPVKPVYRIGILLVVVAFNLVRMRLAKRKAQAVEEEVTPYTATSMGD